MIDTIFDDFAMERLIKDRFGLHIEVENIIAGHIPVSHTVSAAVFLTDKKHLYAYIAAQSSLTLGDVKKFVRQMGLKAETYVPPKGHPNYFDDIARQKFNAVFPGRIQVSSDDLIYYRTLVPYNPALVQISEIPSGEIRQFDTDAHGNWRVAARFAYRRIRTS
ncbi:MAG: hypothetical protein QG549_254 [Patescibacteria group bacterium]|nr:hypothetical protein [Patescibacteria group bacterium]